MPPYATSTVTVPRWGTSTGVSRWVANAGTLRNVTPVTLPSRAVRPDPDQPGRRLERQLRHGLGHRQHPGLEERRDDAHRVRAAHPGVLDLLHDHVAGRRLGVRRRQDEVAVRGRVAARLAEHPQAEVVAVRLEPGHRVEHRRARHGLDPADDHASGLAAGVEVDGADRRTEPERRVTRSTARRVRRTRSAAALRVGHLAGDVATGVAVGDVATTVVELLAAGQAQLDLRPALAGQVQPERDDRQALRLRLAEQLVDLGAVEEQLADPLGLVVVAVGLLERRDVGADQPRLVALDARVGVGEVDLAGPDRLDLGAGQDDPGLERVLDAELVPCPPVEGDVFSGIVRAPSYRAEREVAGSYAMRASSARRPETQESRPIGPAFPKLSHPQGVRLDGHLLRGGAATRTVDHCTSPPFVPGNRTRR